MSKLYSVAVAVGLAFVLNAPVQAMPMSPPVQSSAIVIQVAGGCGTGWHRGPHGGCLRNYARPALHRCPRGFHVGPGGRCRANGR